MSNAVRVQLIPADLLPPAPGVDLPTIDPHTYMLVDDDEKECRVISEDELEADYVDRDIETFKLRNVDWLTLDVDKEYVDITYSRGATASILLGSIDDGSGVAAEQYGKSKGVIYPIDDSGALLLNNANTPRLVAMRTWYWNEAKRVNDERIQIAEVVHSFAEAIGTLGNATEHQPSEH
jgi:hypothetical protein